MNDYFSSTLTRVCKYTCYGFLVLIFQFCSKTNDQSTGIPHTTTDVDTLLREKVLGSLYSSHITEQLYNSGLPYRKALLLDVQFTDHLLKQSNKYIAAANLGIYLSDLNYLMKFGRTDEAKKYFESCYRLSEYVGMKKQFGNAIQSEFDGIIKNDTALKTTLESLFNHAGNSVDGEELRKLYITALTGYYIEELYHAISALKSQELPSDSVVQNILIIVSDQTQELNILIACFDHVQMKQEGIIVYQDLLDLQTLYLTLARERQSNNADLTPQDERLTQILNTVILIRNGLADV